MVRLRLGMAEGGRRRVRFPSRTAIHRRIRTDNPVTANTVTMNPLVATPSRFLLGLLAFALTAWARATSDTATLRILQPASPTTVQLATPISFHMELESPADTAIGPVTVYAGNQFLGVAQALPQAAIFPPPPARFAFLWSRPPLGTHAVEAVALIQRPGQSVRELVGSPTVVLVVTPENPPTNSVPVVSVRTLRASITEAEGPVEVFELHRTGNLGGRLRVRFQMGGDASNTVDYAIPFGALAAEFPAGEDSVAVVLRPVGDALAEGSESVTLSILPPTGAEAYVVGNPGRAESAIRDRDMARPASIAWVRPAQGSGFVPGGPVVLDVIATDPSGYLPDVEYVVSDSDGRNTRKIGESSIRFLVAPTNGTPIGHSLTWQSTNAFAGINRIRALATTAGGIPVVSPDLLLVGVPSGEAPRVRVNAEVASASEAVPESAFVFRIERDGSADAPLTVRFSMSGSATRGSDYHLEKDPCPLCARPTILLREDWIEFAPGVRSVRVGGIAVSDRVSEGDETVELHLEPALDRDAPYRIDENSSVARASIEDADPATDLPTVTLHTLDGVATETNGADGLRFEVRRSGPAASALSVHYRFSGSARYLADFRRTGESFGSDPSLFLPAPLVVEIAAGQTNAFLDLEALPDVRVEGEETVVVTLAQPEPLPYVRMRPTYEVGRPESARGLIRDTPATEGERPTVRLFASAAEVREPVAGSAASIGSFLLSRSGSTGSPLKVRYTVSGTASNGRDFVYLDGDITLPAGADSTPIRLVPLPDRYVESDETVVLTLAPDRHYRVDDAGPATVVIHDAVSGPDPIAWIRLLNPVDGARFTQPAAVSFRAFAVDVAADIRRVEFLDGDVVVGVSEHLTRDAVIPGAPRIHEWAWTNPPAGTHRLHARADVRGTVVRSETVEIAVVPAPTNSPSRLHPADVATPSSKLDAQEFLDYANAWRSGTAMVGAAGRIPASYVSRAGFLVASGGRYAWREGVREPLAWIPMEPTTNVTGLTIAKDESTKPVLVSLSETTLSGFLDTSVLDLPSLWPGGMPEREPLSFAVLEMRRTGGRTNEVDLVLRLLPATGTFCQVAELFIGPGLSVTNLSDNAVHDAAAGMLRFGPFTDDANRRVTATVTGAAATAFSGFASFDGRDVRFRIGETRSQSTDDSRPRITSVERRNDGAVQVVVVDDSDTTAAGVSFLECSDDLVNWRRIGEFPGTAVGATHVDADAADHPVRYYRVGRN